MPSTDPMKKRLQIAGTLLIVGLVIEAFCLFSAKPIAFVIFVAVSYTHLDVYKRQHQGWSANLFTTASDMFPRSSVAAVVGIGGMAGSVGAVLFSLSTGWVLQSYHSYAPLFSVAATSYLAGLLFLHLLAPGLTKADVPTQSPVQLAK